MQKLRVTLQTGNYNLFAVCHCFHRFVSEDVITFYYTWIHSLIHSTVPTQTWKHRSAKPTLSNSNAKLLITYNKEASEPSPSPSYQEISCLWKEKHVSFPQKLERMIINPTIFFIWVPYRDLLTSRSWLHRQTLLRST